MMRASATAQERANGWSIAASALLHMLLCLLVLLLPVAPYPSAPREKNVEVEIVALPAISKDKSGGSGRPSSPQPETAAPKDEPNERARKPAHPADGHPPDASPAMVRPTRMLSEKVLSDPRSGKSRKRLATLAPADQIEQLCGLEAMAQVAAWQKALQPDRVIAYALADPKFSGDVLVADGAALHGKGKWYRLRFTCTLTPDHKKVAAFAFLVGDPIPQPEWATHNLPDEAEPLD